MRHHCVSCFQWRTEICATNIDGLLNDVRVSDSPPLPWLDSGYWARASSVSRFRDHTHTTYGWTSLDEWSARRRDLYLTHNTPKRQTYMAPAGFEPTIQAIARPQTHASEGAVTGSGIADCWRKTIPWLVILY